jgi:hypothetical protein
MVATQFGTGQVFWSLLYFFMFFIWLWLLIAIFGDIFRSQDLSGWGKALWSIFVIFLPYLGVFVYLIARGKKMGEHAQQAAQAQDQAFKAYVRDAAGSAGTGPDQLAQLAQLHDTGVIDDAEFARMKAKVTAA